MKRRELLETVLVASAKVKFIVTIPSLAGA